MSNHVSTSAMDRDQLVRSLGQPATESVKLSARIVTALFFVSLALICFVPVTSGIVTQGFLASETARQSVQHPQGGVVRQIFVKDGQRVRAGDVVIKLDSVLERATAEIAFTQVASLQAEMAVRQAEMQNATDVKFPEGLTSRAKMHPEVGAVLAAHRGAFEARRKQQEFEVAQIHQQIAKNEQSARQAEARATASRTQLSLVTQEVVSFSILLEKGLTVRSRVLQLQQRQAGLNGDVTSYSSEVLRLRAENVELRNKLSEPGLDLRVRAAEALRTLQGELSVALDRNTAAQSALNSTAVRAPTDGTVINLRAETIGGVVRASEPMMEIVPHGQRLQIKARINLGDADNIHQGMRAFVRFDLAQGSSAPQVTGVVQIVSADSIEDPRTGHNYFEAKISISPEEAARVPKASFSPGLPAEILIETGSRTLLSYFMTPFDRAAF